MHVSKIIPRERVIQQTVEEVVEISVPMTQGNIVLVPTVANHRGHHHVEQEVIVEVHVPHERKSWFMRPRSTIRNRSFNRSLNRWVMYPHS